VVNETVNGISIVKVFTMERYEIERVRTEITRLRRFLLQMVRLHATTGPVTEFILVLGVTVFLLYAAKRMETGELKLGELTTLLIALAMLLDPLRKMSAVNNMIQTSIASAERVFEFIDMTPEIDEREGAPALVPMERSIRFDNVTFGYSSEVPVLQNFSLDVRKGETVALVGPSGSGKSTIIKLIPRFYDIQGGAILIDGQNISEVSAHSLREQISLVTQNTILFAETIRENIAAGQSHYTQEEIERAARTAHAVEFIEKLPKGYDTRMDEGGSTLSGGQRQRLAIARAFIKDPSILILDEATSSLDSESERLIQDALDHFLDGRTAFIIAHRLSTIQRADRILLIQDGRIVEEGSHSELLAKNGAYARLYRTQFDTQEPLE
jgi:subfamily B ATP-binding cassette protein MsbA